MHPPLDRPHPDCGEVIAALKQCHATSGLYKYAGACNDIKNQVDQCLRHEKKRLLDELNADIPERLERQEQIIKMAFGKDMTYTEYLAKDRERRAAKQQQQQKGTAVSGGANSSGETST